MSNPMHPSFATPERDAQDAATAATRRLKTLQYELTPADVERLLSFAADAEVAFALRVITDRAAALRSRGTWCWTATLPRSGESCAWNQS